MNKQHHSPEFQVIRQNEANAKSFVASGEPMLTAMNAGGNHGNPASSYDDGGDINM